MAAATRLPRSLNVLAGWTMSWPSESCLTLLRSILSSSDRAAIERRVEEER
jgi:hypothetical protein